MNNITFDLEKFYLGKLCLSGHNWNNTGQSLRRKANRGCIQCLLNRTQNWRKKHREHISDYNRSYGRENRAKLTQKKREQYQKNPEPVRQNHSRYRLKNRGKCREWDRNNYYKNRPAILVRQKQWREQNQEYIKQYRSSREGKFAGRAADHKRDARKRLNHHFKYTLQEVNIRLKDFDFSCAYCDSTGDLTLDHFIPISKGGSDCIGNLVPACRRCNSSKSARDVHEWYEEQVFYSKRRWKRILKALGKTEANYLQISLF